MQELEKLINTLGDFYCLLGEEKIYTSGVIVLDKDDYVLRCRVNQSDLKKIDTSQSCRIIGTVDCTELTFLNAYSVTSSYTWGSEYASVVFNPSKILVGCHCDSDLAVTFARIEMMPLNWFFSSLPLKPIFDFQNNDSSLVKYDNQKRIIAKDQDGTITIDRTIRFNRSHDGIELTSVPFVEYSFAEPSNIQKTVSKLASFRNLMSFFADYYIPLGKISLCTFKSEDTKTDTPDCELYFNYNEDIRIENEPFLIFNYCVDQNFQKIWENWQEFYEQDFHIPTLFYEIICNRSTHINCFLNLAQAMEIFSDHYRKQNVKKLFAKYAETSNAPTLKHKLQDILAFTENYTGLNNEQIEKIARVISEARNFYTHYRKKKYPAPAYEDIWAASNLLRFVLLSIVYKQIGIEDQYIQQCKSRSSYSTLKSNINRLLVRYDTISQSS